MDEAMENQIDEEFEDIGIRGKLIGKVQARNVHLEGGGAVVISAEEQVTLNSAGGMVITSGRDMSVTSGGGQVVIAGRDIQVSQGGGQVVIAGNDLSVQGGGGLILVGNSARVEGSRVGLLLSREAIISADSKIIMNTPQAAVLGMVLGLTLAGVRLLLGKRR